MRKEKNTWKIPRLALVEVHVWNRLHNDLRVANLPDQVEAHKLIVCRMKAKPRRKFKVGILLHLDGVLAVAHTFHRNAVCTDNPWVEYQGGVVAFSGNDLRD